MLLKMALDRGIKATAQFLKEKHLKIDTTYKQIELALTQHTKEIINWSTEVKFNDLTHAKRTTQVFVNLEILLVPVKTIFDESEVPKRLSSRDIFTEVKSHLVILGQPGAGKSTLMKFICQSVLTDEDYYPGDINIPILIRLRDLNTKFSGRIEKAPIINHLFDLLGLTLKPEKNDIDSDDIHIAKEKILLPLLEELKCLIILDGYDEITEKKYKSRVIEDFKKLILRLNDARVLLTSRSSDFNYSFENLDVLEICPLTFSQITEFAKKWLENPEKVDKFLYELRSSPFYDTAIRPLTIAHLCAIYERSGKIPDKPKTVYRKIVNLLLEEWDEQRGVQRLSDYGAFETDRKLEFLCNLSYELTTEYRKSTFNDDDLKITYSKIYINFDLQKDQVNDVVQEIESHTGLLIEIGYHRFEFAHKSLQEYLCAEHLVKLPVIPKFEVLAAIPNELAIAVTISSSPSNYFVELVFNYLLQEKVGESFITNFINRLVMEKPDFNSSKELGFALVILYSIFRKSETGQLRLFDFDLPTQFEKFVEMAFKRSKRLTLGGYYELSGKGTTESREIVLQFKRKEKVTSFNGYKLPEYIYAKRAFIADFDHEF